MKDEHDAWCVCANCMATIEAEERPEGFKEWQAHAPWNQIDEQ